eukprot:TRINITY_DN22805_c0_g1_i1.p1 TRINITY_DN22805_c0_g1~~TRINITY_DN22805_c0_g1_i1.p1  ORF type:complete len:544 (+),score=77.17 TRINITY_DN22805_c0_g1_i1:76-1707(+)
MYDATADGMMYSKSHEGDAMQEFIKHHMMSILQPVAQHVRDLQGDVQTVSGDVSGLTIALHQRNQLMDDQSGQLKLVHARVDDVTRRLDMLNAACSKITDVPHCQRRLSQQNSHEEELLSAPRFVNPEMTNELLDALKGLRKRVDGVESTTQELNIQNSKTESSFGEVAASLTRLNEFYDGLNYRYIDMARELESIGKTNIATTRALKKITATVDQQREDYSNQFARIADHASHLDELLGDCNRGTQRLDDRLKSVEGDVQRVQSIAEHEIGCSARLDVMQRSQHEMMSTIKEQGKTLQVVDERIVDLKKELVSEKKATAMQSKDLQIKIDGNASILHDVHELQQSHIGEISRLDRLANDLVRDYRGLREVSEGSIKEIKTLANLQKDHACKIEFQSREMSKTQDELRENGTCLDNSLRFMQSMKEDLGTAVANVSKLNSCYDSCTRNLQGLSRGFQDAHRHVMAGENGMLPPKNGVTLGALTDRQHDRLVVPLRPTTAPSNRGFIRPSGAGCNGRPKTPLRSETGSPIPYFPMHVRSDTGSV